MSNDVSAVTRGHLPRGGAEERAALHIFNKEVGAADPFFRGAAPPRQPPGTDYDTWEAGEHSDGQLEDLVELQSRGGRVVLGKYRFNGWDTCHNDCRPDYETYVCVHDPECLAETRDLLKKRWDRKLQSKGEREQDMMVLMRSLQTQVNNRLHGHTRVQASKDRKMLGKCKQNVSAPKDLGNIQINASQVQHMFNRASPSMFFNGGCRFPLTSARFPAHLPQRIARPKFNHVGKYVLHLYTLAEANQVLPGVCFHACANSPRYGDQSIPYPHATSKCWEGKDKVYFASPLGTDTNGNRIALLDEIMPSDEEIAEAAATALQQEAAEPISEGESSTGSRRRKRARHFDAAHEGRNDAARLAAAALTLRRVKALNLNDEATPVLLLKWSEIKEITPMVITVNNGKVTVKAQQPVPSTRNVAELGGLVECETFIGATPPPGWAGW